MKREHDILLPKCGSFSCPGMTHYPRRIPFLDLELDRSCEAYFQYSGHVAFIIGQPLVQLPRFQQVISTSQLEGCLSMHRGWRENQRLCPSRPLIPTLRSMHIQVLSLGRCNFDVAMQHTSRSQALWQFVIGTQPPPRSVLRPLLTRTNAYAQNTSIPMMAWSWRSEIRKSVCGGCGETLRRLGREAGSGERNFMAFRVLIMKSRRGTECLRSGFSPVQIIFMIACGAGSDISFMCSSSRITGVE
jgi:hypothetical protein